MANIHPGQALLRLLVPDTSTRRSIVRGLCEARPYSVDRQSLWQYVNTAWVVPNKGRAKRLSHYQITEPDWLLIFDFIESI